MSDARPLPPSRAAQLPNAEPRPEWIRAVLPRGPVYEDLKQLFRTQKLHTVCEEARCPNLGECWSSGTATLLLGSPICTRACRFCAVRTARRPPPLDPEEPTRVAESLASLKHLRYVVLTSVDRDDLPDGGASHFAGTIQAIKRSRPDLLIEALVPDFRGDVGAIQTLVQSGLDVYAHNLETVRRLHPRVRDPRAHYDQSLQTLQTAKELARAGGQTLWTKSSLMLGFGETDSEIEEALEDLRKKEVDAVTLGQYLRPTPEHLPVEHYYSPEAFETWSQRALAKGFLFAACGPLVRSSYRAAEWFFSHRKESQHAVSIT